jgi:hypothetical protein
MINKRNMLSSKQEQILALKEQIALINSHKPKKEYPVRHKKQDKKLDLRKTNFTGSQAWRNKKSLTHETHVKVINESTWRYCSHHHAWGRHTSESCLKAKSQRHKCNKQFTNTQSNLQVTMADLNIHDVSINDDNGSV